MMVVLLYDLGDNASLDNGSNCVPLDDGRTKLSLDDDGNGLHIDIW